MTADEHPTTDDDALELMTEGELLALAQHLMAQAAADHATADQFQQRLQALEEQA